MRATLHRLAALTVKESRQIRRDPSSIALAVLLPLLLLILFGYGMSMDVRNIKMTVVMPESSRGSAQHCRADAAFTLFPDLHRADCARGGRTHDQS